MAISFTPGEVVSWDDLNAMMAQHGSPQGAKSRTHPTLTEQQRIAFEDQGINPDHILTYHFADGSSVTAIIAQQGEENEPGLFGQGSTFRVIEYKPSATYISAQNRATARAEREPQEGEVRGPGTGPTREVFEGGQWVVRPNPLYQPKPEENKPPEERVNPEDPNRRQRWNPTTKAWEDAGSIAQKPADPAKPPEERVNPEDPNRRQRWNPTSKAWEDAGPIAQKPADPAKPPEERVNPADPTRRERWNPTTRAWEDAGVIAPKPADPNKPPEERVNPEDPTRRQRWNPTTKAWEDSGGVYDKDAFVPEPPGAPPISTTYGTMVESTTKYRDWLNQQVTSGALKPAQATQLMAARLSQAQAMMAEQQQVTANQTAIRGQSITDRGQTLADTASRRSNATQVYTTVLNQFMPLTRYLPKGGGKAFADALMAAVNLGRENAEAWGGMRESPEIPMGPAQRVAAGAAMPGGAPTFMDQYQPVQMPEPPPVAPNLEPPSATLPPPDLAVATDTTDVGGVPRQYSPASSTTPAAPAPVAPVQMAPPAPAPRRVPVQGTFLESAAARQPVPATQLETLFADPWMNNENLAIAYQEVWGMPAPWLAGQRQ